MNTWTVIFFYGRGNQVIYSGLTQEEVQESIRITVFSNKDSVNFSCFRVDDEG